MLTERLEESWIDAFARAFACSAVARGESVAVLSETLSRRVLVELAEHALHRLGARVFHVVVPSPAATSSVPIRSTGASTALIGQDAVIKALAGVPMIVDVTVEGLMHAAATPTMLRAGSRIIHVSNEHPEILARLVPDEALRVRTDAARARLASAKLMHVTSRAGTDLTVKLDGAPAVGSWGAVVQARRMDHWPGGLVAAFPKAGSVEGVLALDRGDINLAFKRYLETPVRLTIREDFVTAIDGDGLDAELMRSHFAAWGDRNAYAVSHVGWGLNERARWDAMTFYDRGDHNGTEQRVVAGSFLYSTGANEFAGRHTPGHFDLPLRNCTIMLDGEVVVCDGRLA
jgi:2,5-dihydroxypyridine 5,6-dioxygenase